MNKSKIINRIILLAILPTIAIIIYIHGQHYDPAMIDFQVSINAPALLPSATLYPKEISGYHLASQPHNYTKDNLSDYVDGHAEYFIGSGFKGLTVIEYVRLQDNSQIKSTTDTSLLKGSQTPSMILDIYDMGKDIQAKGVVLDEAGKNPTTTDFGSIGFAAPDGITFASGKFYIKITAFDKDAPIKELAKALSKSIGVPTKSGKADEFDRFPNIGKVVGTKFIKEDYRGLDFVHNVYERRYLIDGKKTAISYTIGGDNIIARYIKFLDDNGIKHISIKDGKITYQEIFDKYEGDWYLLSDNGAVFGIYGDIDGQLVKQIIKLICANQKRVDNQG